MKAKNIMICWKEDTGEVKVINHPAKNGEAQGWRAVGACNRYWSQYSKTDIRMMIFVEAWHAVVRDGIDPKIMHQELLKIDEYRDGLAGDVQGLEAYPEDLKKRGVF